MRNQRRLQLATVGLAAVLTATGCTAAGPADAGGTGGGGGGGGMSAPVPSTSTAPATLPPLSARPVPDRAPTVIPVRAFMALPEEMRFGQIRVGTQFDRAVPPLCGGEFAAGRMAAATAAVVSAYQLRDEPSEGSLWPGVVYQTIRTYNGSGSAAFMRGLRADLASCTSFTRAGVPFRVRTAALSGVGDEALTIDLIQPQTDLPGNPIGGDQINRIVVIRVGDTVTILWDAPYENSSSKPAVVADFARRAVDTIHVWRS
ncbi:hypothetical protein Ais01nite_14670 [Asanoa ishikariensis]|uniref:PknH-like extracellular domain-containing protein n=1 Tax=Asanoa ishikariensis TaxID=137265 RepID=A0A1H3UIB6_9ACTN|nr:hypothetical protein [Asanoa ishikariensis]GIF63432.1 hypothetical protein Ais01nite_14670 [Asanoa ishikariensis]SDZ62223.1 hypothetical protein SAMN05421684_7406 [Asanoa ishikariensis]